MEANGSDILSPPGRTIYSNSSNVTGTDVTIPIYLSNKLEANLSELLSLPRRTIYDNSSNVTDANGTDNLPGNLKNQAVNVNALSSKTIEGLGVLNYYNHIMSTLVLLFYLFALPVIVVIVVLIWRMYLNACESCERTLSRRHSVTHTVVDMQDFRLRHECCKKNVAPILFSLPTDFNFKHNCGAKCKGPKVWQPDIFP